jgi:hypothetical protein
MKIRALILLASLASMTAIHSRGQTQPPAPPAPEAQPAPPEATAQPQPQPPAKPAQDFKYFFTATNAAFEAYLDQASLKMDRDGNKLVTVKLMKFSGAFRNWIKSNFPGGETADYAIDSYSIDCEARKVGEHEITWLDSSSTELANYDFGGTMSTPINYSLKENLMKKLCGLP